MIEFEFIVNCVSTRAWVDIPPKSYFSLCTATKRQKFCKEVWTQTTAPPNRRWPFFDNFHGTSSPYRTPRSQPNSSRWCLRHRHWRLWWESPLYNDDFQDRKVEMIWWPRWSSQSKQLWLRVRNPQRERGWGKVGWRKLKASLRIDVGPRKSHRPM